MPNDKTPNGLSKHGRFVLKHVTPQNYAIFAAITLSTIAYAGCVYALSRQLASEQAIHELLNNMEFVIEAVQ